MNDFLHFLLQHEHVDPYITAKSSLISFSSSALLVMDKSLIGGYDYKDFMSAEQLYGKPSKPATRTSCTQCGSGAILALNGQQLICKNCGIVNL